MIRFLADENFKGRILRGLLARNPFLDILRWQDIGKEGEPDSFVLERAAMQGRVLLTHDMETMVGLAYERVQQDLPMPGVFAIDANAALRTAIDDLLLVAETAIEGEYENLVIFMPL